MDCFSDDLWVVSKTLDFELDTFIACSAFFGPSSANEVELLPLTGFFASSWPTDSECSRGHPHLGERVLTLCAESLQRRHPCFPPCLECPGNVRESRTDRYVCRSSPRGSAVNS